MAYALENITGRNFTDSLFYKLIFPLNLSNTYYWYAPENVGIVPGNVNDTLWYTYLGDASP
jgi:hypothetical protein